MVKSNIVEFHQFSQDFLRLLGEKTRQAERNRSAQEELTVMEWFYSNIEALIRKYELELHEAKLIAVNSQIKARMYHCDMKDMLNEMYKVRHKISVEELARITKRMALPSFDELKEDVPIKLQSK
jgi:hypothetical protein